MTTTSDAGATGDGTRTGLRRPGLTLAVLAGALGLDVSGLGVLNAALPDVEAHFDIGSTTLQWTMTSYAVTFAGFLLLGGRAADVLGRRLMFVTGIALFVVAALAGALAPTIGVLIVARAVQGIGAALSGPATLALIGELFREGPERNKAMTVYASVGAASFSGGVVLGGVLTDLFGWRAVLLFSMFFGLVVLGLARTALPAGVRHPEPLDLPGAALVTIGLVLMVFGVSRGGDAGWTDPAAATALVAAVVLLTGFVLWERRATDALLPPRVLRPVPVRISALIAFAHYTGAVGLLFFAPLYLQGMLGYSAFESGLAVVPSSIVLFFVANMLTSRLLGTVGPRPLMIAGVLLIGLSTLAWLPTGPDSSYWLVLPGLLLTGIGQGLTFPAMTVGSLTGVPQEQHGVAGAANVTAQQIGSSVGVAALVVVAAAFTDGSSDQATLDGYHAAYVASAALCAGAAVVALLARRGWATTPPTAPEPAGEGAPAQPAAAG